MYNTDSNASPAPVTEKQLAFLNKLVEERDQENLEVVITCNLMKANALNIKTASKCIDAMLKLPKAAPKAPAKPVYVPTVQTPVPAAAPKIHVASAFQPTETKVGLYDTMSDKPAGEMLSSRYIMVYKNAKGYLQAKRVYKSYDTKTGWSWKKVSIYLIKVKLEKGTAVPVDAESASYLGKKYGFCMYCGKTLTTDESLQAGYGPKCAGTYGLPWGN